MTLVVAVWGGKDGFRKQTQMGFCSKNPQTSSGDGGVQARKEPRERGAQRQRPIPSQEVGQEMTLSFDPGD